MSLTSLQLAWAAQEERLLGFSPSAGANQRGWERQFDSAIQSANLRDWMKRLSAKPHHVGSPYGRENAEFIASLLRSWGYQTRIETYQVLFPVPKKRLVELVHPTRFRARLQEPELAEDSTSGILKNQLPSYNAYSADGDVTAELVYVNQGIPRDYEELERRGIDVSGKIVIARYGGSWRGIKPKVAAEHGAVACLIYSDPRDDGYFQGDVYPKGAYRNPQGAQRGSVSDLPLFPGDPLTPGRGAVEGAERLDRSQATTLMKIPVLPLSYADAQPLLEALSGPVAPQGWRGALPITYHIGPGPAQVHLQLEFDWTMANAYNVVARIEGSEFPDQWVIRGNHHDAWVFGAADPISGLVVLLEEARVLGQLVQAGLRPKRTIVYAAWDAEEPGLLGSTEWVEDHAAELDEKTALYINTDGSGRGFLSMGGSHTLEAFINQVARDVTDPQTGVDLVARVRARRSVSGDHEADHRSDLRISPLGSGSDYSPFLQHLGIASLNLGFGGESGGGSYHSVFDSFDHYVRFGDPGFRYGRALVQVTGRVTLRFAQAEILPYRFSGFADSVSLYLKELTGLVKDMRQDTQRRNRLIEADAFRLAADPTETYVPPEPQESVPHLNFAPLENAVDHLVQRADEYDGALAGGIGESGLVSRDAFVALNDVLHRIERSMIRKEGLPRRPWFRHHIYAPGFYTGYGVKTLPGVREAIEERGWSEAEVQIRIVAKVINDVAGRIEEAHRLLVARQ